MHIFGLVFIFYLLKLSAGKGFMFLLHNDLPSVISIHHRCHFIILMHWLLTLNSSLFQLFCLLCCCCANHIMTCSTKQHMYHLWHLVCLILASSLLFLNRSLSQLFVSWLFVFCLVC